MNTDLLLSHIFKHISLDAEEIQYFCSLLKERKLRAGIFLLREGDLCRHQSFVTRGALKTFFLGENGVEHIIDFSIEEWWADDLYSMLTQTPARLNIKAIEDTTVLQISKTDLDLLYKKIPRFERFFRILFQNAYITQREQINNALSTSAEERYQLFLQKKPYAEKRFPQKDIASYLGITPQFFSKMKNRMDRIEPV